MRHENRLLGAKKEVWKDERAGVGAGVGRGVGAGVGRGVGDAVGHVACDDCVPRHDCALDRMRYLYPIECGVPDELDCELGVFCVVEQWPQPPHLFQHPGFAQPGSHPCDSRHAPVGEIPPPTLPEHAEARVRYRVPLAHAPWQPDQLFHGLCGWCG